MEPTSGGSLLSNSFLRIDNNSGQLSNNFVISTNASGTSTVYCIDRSPMRTDSLPASSGTDIRVDSIQNRLRTTVVRVDDTDDEAEVDNTEIITQTIRCNDCHTDFPGQCSFESHECLPESLQVLPPHVCDQCPRAFYEDVNLLLHKASSHLFPDEKLSCPQCSRNFSRNASFKSHIMNHLTSKICPDCDIDFSTERLMKKHLFKTHMSPSKSTKRKEEKVQKCEQCQQTFKTSIELVAHRKLHAKIS